jgi:hypothetical protein
VSESIDVVSHTLGERPSTVFTVTGFQQSAARDSTRRIRRPARSRVIARRAPLRFGARDQYTRSGSTGPGSYDTARDLFEAAGYQNAEIFS